MIVNRIATPVGPFTMIIRDDDRLVRAAFDLDASASPTLHPIAESMKRYFEGDLDALASMAVADDLGTPFQRSVWKALREIPLGETCTYSDIAHRIRNPNGVRAVGLANGKNPIWVVVPCHRVIGKNGALTGYAGGLERKEWLLRHEGGYFVGAKPAKAAKTPSMLST